VIGLVVVLAAVTVTLAALLVSMRSRTRRLEDRLAVALETTEEPPDLPGAALAVVAARKTAEKELGLMTAAAAAVHLGVIILDESGRRVFANEVAENFSPGRAGDAVVGLRLRALLQTARETSESIQDDIEVFTPSPRTIRLSCMPLARDEVRIGTVAFIEDLTSRSRVETIRRDFVSNASHELKTPLGALRLLAEALVATDSEEARLRLSERIGSEAARMTRLVEDILDLALVEETRRVHGAVELCDVARDAISQTELAASTLGVDVQMECEPISVLGDRRRLVSAVANLIENAVVYTSAKGEAELDPVQVRVFTRNESAVVEVEDYGIGIPERHIGRIFERFYRVDRGRSRARGGTGLGLAIVRHVVQNHWGEIEVDSVPGKGSTFRIVLPARE
jgi:signal transduction histidine kinase